MAHPYYCENQTCENCAECPLSSYGRDCRNISLENINIFGLSAAQQAEDDNMDKQQYINILSILKSGRSIMDAIRGGQMTLSELEMSISGTKFIAFHGGNKIGVWDHYPTDWEMDQVLPYEGAGYDIEEVA